MVSLYTWATPNGRKISILLEELGLTYTVVPVNLGRGEQSGADFLALSPNGRIPALVDEGAGAAPVCLFESGAILTYLAEKSGRFLPPAGPGRYVTLSWLHWQTASLGPAMAQLFYFNRLSNERAPFAISRFLQETTRVLDIMERRLAGMPYLAGERYSIADIACYPWVAAAPNLMGDVLDDKPALLRWLKMIGERPAVARGMTVPYLPKAES